MKYLFALTVLAAAAMPFSVSANQQLIGGVFSPEQGIICDRKAGFCADSMGISLAFTSQYLGDDAMQKFSRIISKVKEFDTSSFVMSNGVECNAKLKVCYTNKYDKVVDKQHTKALFSGDGFPQNGKDNSMVEKELEGIDASGLENLK